MILLPFMNVTSDSWQSPYPHHIDLTIITFPDAQSWLARHSAHRDPSLQRFRFPKKSRKRWFLKKVWQEIPTSNVAPAVGHFDAFPSKEVRLSPESNKILHTSVERVLFNLDLSDTGQPKAKHSNNAFKGFQKFSIFSPRRSSSECLAISVWAALLQSVS